MSLRETLNRHPRATSAATIALIALALILSVWQLWPRAREADTIHSRGFYSIDDGATWFEDDLTKVPPFPANGKEAYRAAVFKCGWAKPFVAYLSRFTPEMKKRIEEATAAGREISAAVILQGQEVKKPQDGTWMSAAVEEAKRYTYVTCPDGKTDAKAVWP